MISMHSSTHSSQMNTVGPASNLRTSCWLLPQKEQYRVLFESPLAALVMVSSHSLDEAGRWTGSASPRALRPSLAGYAPRVVQVLTFPDPRRDHKPSLNRATMCGAKPRPWAARLTKWETRRNGTRA